MRSAALYLLAIAAPACNWVFGIDKTLQADAGPPTDSPPPTARLSWLVAVTNAAGNPTEDLEVAAITPAPRVKVARLGEPLIDAPIDDTGTITLPYGFETGPWRLEYKLADGVPHEIQWTITAGRIPHAIVPIFGRLTRSPIPGPNTVLTMTPSNGMPPNHSAPIVYTTGVWTRSDPASSFPSGPTFNHDFDLSVQLSGPPGVPDHTKGDHIVLVDTVTGGPCTVSLGSAAFELALTDGPSTTISAGPWQNHPKPIMMTAPGNDRARVGVAASSMMGSDVTTIVQAGPAASFVMPAFTQRTPELKLAGPLMFPLLRCTDPTLPALPMYGLPVSLVDFPQVAHLEVAAERPVNGLKLPHGIVAVRPIEAERADFVTDIAMPLPPFMLGGQDVSTADGTVLLGGSGPFMLTFALEPTGTNDYYEVLLHRVNGSSAVVEHTFTMIEPMLTIDRSILAAGGTYVFEIRAFNGAPDARFGDFTRYLNKQTSAVVWSHTFIAP